MVIAQTKLLLQQGIKKHGTLLKKMFRIDKFDSPIFYIKISVCEFFHKDSHFFLGNFRSFRKPIPKNSDMPIIIKNVIKTGVLNIDIAHCHFTEAIFFQEVGNNLFPEIRITMLARKHKKYAGIFYKPHRFHEMSIRHVRVAVKFRLKIILINLFYSIKIILLQFLNNIIYRIIVSVKTRSRYSCMVSKFFDLDLIEIFIFQQIEQRLFQFCLTSVLAISPHPHQIMHYTNHN